MPRVVSDGNGGGGVVESKKVVCALCSAEKVVCALRSAEDIKTDVFTEFR